MVHELRVERTKRKAWTVQEHYYIFQVIFWGQMLSLALSSSSFLHNHALCQLQAVLLAINTTFVVFCWLFTLSIWQVQCQGLSLISRFRYSHTLCICHCFSSIWLFTFRRVTFHTWACKCSIRQYHRQSDHCFTPTCAFTVHSAQCTTLLINFLCAMCK